MIQLLRVELAFADLTLWCILAHFSPRINPAAPVFAFLLSFCYVKPFPCAIAYVPGAWACGMYCFSLPLWVSTWICLIFDSIHSLFILLQSFADDVSSIRKAILPISEWPQPTYSLKPSSWVTSSMMSLQTYLPPGSQTHLCRPPKGFITLSPVFTVIWNAVYFHC